MRVNCVSINIRCVTGTAVRKYGLLLWNYNLLLWKCSKTQIYSHMSHNESYSIDDMPGETKPIKWYEAYVILIVLDMNKLWCWKMNWVNCARERSLTGSIVMVRKARFPIVSTKPSPIFNSTPPGNSASIDFRHQLQEDRKCHYIKKFNKTKWWTQWKKYIIAKAIAYDYEYNCMWK